MAVRILLLEDDESLADGLIYSLEKKEYDVQLSGNVREAKQLLGEKEYDLLLLDVALPDGTGFEVCEMLRAKGNQTPIIFLTASDDEIHVIRGLDSGGDDYITKPFRMDELLARISAHLRREERKGTAENLRFDEELMIDYNSRTVFYGKEQLDFSNKEFEIIRFLSQNAGMVFDRETIYEKLWGYHGEGDSIVVKEHIRKIRNKLSVYTDKNYIETVWGVGYKWAK